MGSVQPLFVLSSNDIHPDTCKKYKQLITEAEQYKNIYGTIDSERKKQFHSRIQVLVNKLQKNTCQLLSNELLGFLSGHKQHMGEEVIHVSNEAGILFNIYWEIKTTDFFTLERLACLTILTKVILGQLRGNDLTEIRSEVLLPLISAVSGSIENKEFQTTFLEHLHQMCPYTVPYYPKYESTMTNEKQDDTQYFLENTTEFLNRMSGLIRLFCKLLVYDGPPFNQNLALAWKWFADVLNLPPRPDITALLIHIFLTEVGTDMNHVYPT
jgi:hypothetical protein